MGTAKIRNYRTSSLNMTELVKYIGTSNFGENEKHYTSKLKIRVRYGIRFSTFSKASPFLFLKLLNFDFGFYQVKIEDKLTSPFVLKNPDVKIHNLIIFNHM